MWTEVRSEEVVPDMLTYFFSFILQGTEWMALSMLPYHEDEVLEGWEQSLKAEPLPRRHKALGPIPSTTQNKTK